MLDCFTTYVMLRYISPTRSLTWEHNMKLVSESRQVGATMRRDSSAINFHRAGWHVEINNSLSKTIHQRKVPSKMTVKNRLVGPVVKRPPRERRIPGSNPACTGIFSGSSYTSDLKIGTSVAIMPRAWCYRVSAGTDRPGVSIL